MQKQKPPKWATKHKTKNTQIYTIKGKYYLYQVTSKWNKQKGRAQKITKQYLGRITEQGLTPPKTKQTKTIPPNSITQKEYGATKTLTNLTTDILEKLCEKLPQQANLLYAIALTRLINKCPLKNIQWHYETSTLSDILPNLNLSPKELSLFMRQFGNYRTQMVEFMQQYITEDEHILFDGTQIISNSEKLVINQVGYNSHEDFAPQINLLYAFAVNTNTPAYYRITNGDVCDVVAFKLCLQELSKKKMIVVADKGFGSEANFELLEKSELGYVVPLKRSSVLIDKGRLKSGNRADFDGHFMYCDRPVWYYRCGLVFVYLDGDLRNEEEKCYLRNVARSVEGYTVENFLVKQFDFGCVALKTNLGRDAEEVYLLYRQRREIELSFDFLKNLLLQDRSYMQNEWSLESWAFINHLTLMMVYRVYDLLRRNKLLSKVSVEDFLRYLKGVRTINWEGQWHITEIPKKTRILLETLNLPMA